MLCTCVRADRLVFTLPPPQPTPVHGRQACVSCRVPGSLTPLSASGSPTRWQLFSHVSLTETPLRVRPVPGWPVRRNNAPQRTQNGTHATLRIYTSSMKGEEGNPISHKWCQGWWPASTCRRGWMWHFIKREGVSPWYDYDRWDGWYSIGKVYRGMGLWVTGPCDGMSA